MRRERRMSRRRQAAAVAPQHVPEIGPFRARHLDLAYREIATGTETSTVTVNDGESPLGWLARRKGRDGKALISSVQFIAGERLRADFTRANLGPRVTSSWEQPVSRGSGAAGGGAGAAIDAAIAARQRVQHALKAVGPEFSGLLIDVCCFLRRLEDIERERGWPLRSAKVVLQLGLARLARHYGLGEELTGPSQGAIRVWLAGE